MAEEFIEQQLDRIEGKVDRLLAREPGGQVPTPPTAPPTTPPTSPSVPSGRKPVDVLPILADWTVTLPIAKPGTTDSPVNDYPDKLTGAEHAKYFYAATDAAGEHVVFRVNPAGAVHTKNSKYGRSEAREMVPGKRWDEGAWSSAVGSKLTARLAIDTSKLVTRKRCNGLQIHDGADDVMQVMRHETQGLGVMYRDGKAWLSLDPNYNGEVFDCVISVGGSKVTVTARGKTVSFTQVGTGWYFKAGCYSQTGGASEFVEPSSAEVAVRIYALSVG